MKKYCDKVCIKQHLYGEKTASLYEKNPLISVVVPVYNVALYLTRCIHSIMEQTYDNLEILLIDDGSADLSGKICDDMAHADKRIKVIHKQNGGLSSARNQGLDIANGQYICFVDSDDWLASNYIECMYKILEETGCEIVSCRYQYVKKFKCRTMKADGKIFVYNKMNARIWYLESLFAAQNDTSCCTKLYKKDIIEKCRFEEGRTFEDVVFNWDLLNKVDKYAYYPCIGYSYFLRDDSITTKSIFSVQNYDLIYGAEHIIETIDPMNCKLSTLGNQYLAKTHFSVLIKMLKTHYDNVKEINKELCILKKSVKSLIHSPLCINKKIVLLIIYCFFKIFPKENLNGK